MTQNPTDELQVQSIATRESVTKRSRVQTQSKRDDKRESVERVALFERLAQPRIQYPGLTPADEVEAARAEALLQQLASGNKPVPAAQRASNARKLVKKK